MEEERTFSGAIARLFGLILAIVLFILAIWFVVRLVGEITSSSDTTETGVVVTVDDEDSVIDKRVDSEDDSKVVTTNTDEDTTAADDNSSVLAANTEELPDTGAESYILGLFAITLALYMYKRAKQSQTDLQLV